MLFNVPRLPATLHLARSLQRPRLHTYITKKPPQLTRLLIPSTPFMPVLNSWLTKPTPGSLIVHIASKGPLTTSTTPTPPRVRGGRDLLRQDLRPFLGFPRGDWKYSDRPRSGAVILTSFGHRAGTSEPDPTRRMTYMTRNVTRRDMT